MVMRHGGGEERSRVKRSFTKAQASRPWMHDAFVRVEHGLSLRQWILPPVPEQNDTPRATLSTRFYHSTFYNNAFMA